MPATPQGGARCANACRASSFALRHDIGVFADTGFAKIIRHRKPCCDIERARWILKGDDDTASSVPGLFSREYLMWPSKAALKVSDGEVVLPLLSLSIGGLEGRLSR